VATVTTNQEQVEREALRKACWIVGTNVLEQARLSDQQLIATFKGQGGAERGFRAPLRSALSRVLRHGLETRAHHGTQFYHGALRGTIYRLAEFRLRSRLAETRAVHSRSSPQTHRPPHHAALVFQCFLRH
jgi:hypothetical protein